MEKSDAEERYFQKVEAERREKLRDQIQRAAAELQALGTDDEAVGEQIKKLGFSGETAVAFHLAPLVLVAWADGSVSRAERLRILEALEARGEPHDGPAARLLAMLLEKKPSEAWTERVLEVLHRVAPGAMGKDLVRRCERVAEASGSLLGLRNSISADEAKALEAIQSALKRD